MLHACIARETISLYPRFLSADVWCASSREGVIRHWLFLLTDVDFVYDGNPRVNPDAKPIKVVDQTVRARNRNALAKFATFFSTLSRGNMPCPAPAISIWRLWTFSPLGLPYAISASRT